MATFDTKVIFENISDYWKNHLTYKDQNIIKRFWDGLYQGLITVEHRYERTKNLQSLKLIKDYFWVPFHFIRFLFNEDNLIEGLTYSIDDTIQSINKFQDVILEPTKTLVENIDYSIESGTITFLAEPPEELWAEFVYTEDLLPEVKYGKPINFLQGTQLVEDYCTKMYNLYNAYFGGPTKANLKSAIGSLLDLPVATKDGECWKIEDNDIYVGDIVYAIPDGLESVVAVGDEVEQFLALTNGVQIKDYLDSPNWWSDSTAQYCTEITLEPQQEKFLFGIAFKEAVTIDVNNPPADVTYFLNSILSADLGYKLLKEC